LKVLVFYSVQPECTLWLLAGNPVEIDSCFPRLFRISSCAVESATRVYHRAFQLRQVRLHHTHSCCSPYGSDCACDDVIAIRWLRNMMTSLQALYYNYYVIDIRNLYRIRKRSKFVSPKFLIFLRGSGW